MNVVAYPTKQMERAIASDLRSEEELSVAQLKENKNENTRGDDREGSDRPTDEDSEEAIS